MTPFTIFSFQENACIEHFNFVHGNKATSTIFQMMHYEKFHVVYVDISGMYDFRLDVKTIEESDRSGTDPEDESQSMADIQNVGDYQAIFQPSRKRM
jgi:hypothetical protein